MCSARSARFASPRHIGLGVNASGAPIVVCSKLGVGAQGAEPAALANSRDVHQHASRPAKDIVLFHRLAHQAHALLALLARACAAPARSRCAVSSTSYGLTISASTNSREAPANVLRIEHAILVVARSDELLRDQVHAVVQAVDDAEIAGAVQLEHLLRIAVLGRSARRAGNPPCRSAALMRAAVSCVSHLQLLVGRKAAARRRRDLHEHELAAATAARSRAEPRAPASDRRCPW